MPRSIVLFVSLQPPVDSAAAEVERLTGLAMRPGPVAGTWSLDEGDVHAQLHAHSYGEHGDVLLSQFPLALTCLVADEARLADAPETALLRLISESLRGAGVAALLVHDMQYRNPMVATGAAAAPACPSGAGGDTVAGPGS